MKKFISCLLLSVCIFTACGNADKSQEESTDLAEVEEGLEQIEPCEEILNATFKDAKIQIEHEVFEGFGKVTVGEVLDRLNASSQYEYTLCDYNLNEIEDMDSYASSEETFILKNDYYSLTLKGVPFEGVLSIKDLPVMDFWTISAPHYYPHGITDSVELTGDELEEILINDGLKEVEKSSITNDDYNYYYLWYDSNTPIYSIMVNPTYDIYHIKYGYIGIGVRYESPNKGLVSYGFYDSQFLKE